MAVHASPCVAGTLRGFSTTAIGRSDKAPAARRQKPQCRRAFFCPSCRTRCPVQDGGSDQRPRGQVSAKREEAEEEAASEHLLTDPAPHPASHSHTDQRRSERERRS